MEIQHTWPWLCDQVLDTSSQDLRETISESEKNTEEVGIRREERRDSVGKVGRKIGALELNTDRTVSRKLTGSPVERRRD